jgi:hypothetical protein
MECLPASAGLEFFVGITWFLSRIGLARTSAPAPASRRQIVGKTHQWRERNLNITA